MEENDKENNQEKDKPIKEGKNLKYYIIEILEILLYPAFLYVILESIKFNNVPIYIVLKNIIIQAPQYIIVSYIIYLSIILLFRGIIKSNFVANCISTILLTIIVIISFYKYIILEQPFIPYDIFMAKNLNQITEFAVSGTPYILIFSIINIIILLILDYLVNRLIKSKIINKTYKIAKRTICIVFAIVFILNLCISPNRYVKYRIKNDNGDNYSWMGATPVFFMHLGDFYSNTPKEYNKGNLLQIKSEYDNKTNKQEGKQTNIILIMNESFADLTDLSNLTYSENPMKLLEILQNEGNCKTGEVLSPVLGGGTSLPEFEVLTGLTSYFLQEQIYPYTSYIHSDMNSIVREFNKAEYTTIGIHTNTRTFYNRENIYKYLGFKKTVFEEDMINPEYKGNYISDNEAAKQIIEQFDSNEGKKFIFAVTMQNHMKYINKNYKQYDINVDSTVLSDKEKIELKNYTQGVKDACDMYYKLVEYLKQTEEQTVLIMFGDHLPLLGDTYCSTYKKLNLKKIEYYKTPYIIWANYDIEETINIPEVISPSHLGIFTLDIANIENISWFIKPFAELYSNYPAINNKFAIDKTGNSVDKNLLETEEIIKKCQILQYDILMKKKFIPINY